MIHQSILQPTLRVPIHPHMIEIGFPFNLRKAAFTTALPISDGR
jgi:hypothetical protein